MWKSIVQSHRPQTTMCRMLIEYCTPKSTNIHSEYAILNALSLKQRLHEAPQCYVIRHVLQNNNMAAVRKFIFHCDGGEK
jgi:hypothetical protein